MPSFPLLSTIGDRAFAVAGPRAWTLLSAPLPHTTSSKRPQISHFWTFLLIVTIVYFDYVQRSCISLYRLLRFTNCPTYITILNADRVYLLLTAMLWILVLFVGTVDDMITPAVSFNAERTC